jgi:ATP-binding cassette subfamily B protein
MEAEMKPLPKTLLGFYARCAARPFAFSIIVSALLFILSQGGGLVLPPLFQKWFVSLFEQPVPDGMTFVQFAFPVIVVITVIWLAITLVSLLRSIIHNRWRPKVGQRISEILTSYVHSQSMAFWTGAVPGKINSQILYIQNGVNANWNVIVMFSAFAAMLCNIGLVFAINKDIALLLGIVFVFRLAFGAAVMRPMERSSKTASESGSSLSGKVVDSISNYSVVKLFAAGKREQAFLADPRRKFVRDRINASFWQRVFWVVPDFFWDLSFGVLLLLCALMFADGHMRVSDVVFALAVYNSVSNSISMMVNYLPDIVEGFAAASQAYHELVKPVGVADAPNAPDLVVQSGRVEVRGVSFRYKKQTVLDNFSLSISPGEKVGLVGVSGSGKTTLANLLVRLYDPTKGAIFIDGQDIRGVTQDSLRANIAFVPQDPSMFNRTIGENIAYGKPDATMKEIRAAAKRAEIDSFIMGTDKKYSSLIGDRGIKLSGGQRQRVAIARAFLKDAPILIMDEATSALDSETEHAIQKSFADLSRGRTTIVIAHRLSTLRHMDRILVMKKGKIAEQGPHAKLLRKKGGVYAKLWKMQSDGFIA